MRLCLCERAAMLMVCRQTFIDSTLLTILTESSLCHCATTPHHSATTMLHACAFWNCLLHLSSHNFYCVLKWISKWIFWLPYAVCSCLALSYIHTSHRSTENHIPMLIYKLRTKFQRIVTFGFNFWIMVK